MRERVFKMNHSYKTENVCPVAITFDLDGNTVTNIKFMGGCDGNTKAVAKLVNGWTVEKIEEYLLGNDCRGRGTSCADQLARAVRQAYDAENQK